MGKQSFLAEQDFPCDCNERRPGQHTSRNMLPLYNILKINYWHHRIHLRKVLTNSLFNSKPDTLYLSKHRLCCPAEIIEHSHLLPIVDLSGVLCVCVCRHVSACLFESFISLHVHSTPLNELWSSTKAAFYCAPLAPGWYFVWAKMAPLAEDAIVSLCWRLCCQNDGLYWKREERTFQK